MSVQVPGGRLVRGAILVFALAAAAGCQQEQQSGAAGEEAATPRPTGDAPAADPVARGKYLVTVASCNDCHTPMKMGANGPEPDMARMLSGHPEGMDMPMTEVPEPWGFMGSSTLTAWRGPWGISYTANLTPDEETGIGAWDEELFITALRSGKIHGGGRPILPPMPWQFIKQMTDEDLRAVFAYLKSIPAIKNKVPDPVFPPGQAAAGGGQQ